MKLRFDIAPFLARLAQAIANLAPAIANLAKDTRGSHATEMSMAIVFFAIVAAFGFFFLGDAITDFFVALSNPFADAFTPR